METQIYWVTWGISLLVTISNGILTLFKIDKKYYFLHTTYEQLQSEGWQFLELTGRYSGILNRHKRIPTHANQFLYFCYAIEKIKMKQVEEEYFKLSEPTAHAKLAARATENNPSNTDTTNQQPQQMENVGISIEPPLPIMASMSPTSGTYERHKSSAEINIQRQLPPIDKRVFAENINTDHLTPPEPIGQNNSDDGNDSPLPEEKPLYKFSKKVNTLIRAMKSGSAAHLVPSQDEATLHPPLFPPTPHHKQIRPNSLAQLNISGIDFQEEPSTPIFTSRTQRLRSPVHSTYNIYSTADLTDDDDDKQSIHSIAPI